MTNAMEKARAHFSESVNKELAGPFHIPEWDIDWYYSKHIKVKVQQEFLRLHTSKQAHEAIATMVIARAVDEDGKPIFKKLDKVEMMNDKIDFNIIVRMFNEMNDDIEAELGN